LIGLDGVTPIELDLDEPGRAELLVREAVDRHGRLDVLLKRWRHAPPAYGFLEITDADFEGSLQLNFFAALGVTRAAVCQGSVIDRLARQASAR
jgi:NAD(P)-dependent dehydrogenase (short-subunit alcohol dehydrogenase family)